MTVTLLTTIRHSLRVALLGSLCLIAAPFEAAHGQRTWRVQQTGTPHDLRGIAYGNGLFVAVGDNGTLLTSSTGTDWKAQPSGTTRALYSVTYGGGRFVAVGERTILTSTDGVRWVGQEPEFPHLRNVSYAGGRYVAAAGFSGLLTSTDGLHWTEQPLGNGQYLTGVSSNGTSVVAVGGEGAIHTLPADVVRWTPKKIAVSGGGAVRKAADLRDVCYGGGRFVAVGAKAVFSSHDGLTWTKGTSAEPLYLYGLGYGGTEFVAVGYDGVIQTSPDGTVWTAQPSNTRQILYAVSCTNAQVVAVGAGGTIVSAAAQKSAPKAQPTTSARADAHADVTPPSALPAPLTDDWLANGAVERTERAVAYPNPSESGLFRVVVPTGARRLSVMTGQGRTLIDVPSPSASADIDLSRVGGGVYYLRVETSAGGQVLKLVKP